MKPDFCLMPSMSSALVLQGVATTPTNTLTPTTLRNITQIFESEGCLQNLQQFESSGGFQPPTVFEIPSTISFDGNAIKSMTVEQSEALLNLLPTTTYVNSDNKSWQGGTTTIVTPSKVIPHIVGVFKDEEEFERETATPSTDSDDEWMPESVANEFMKPATRRSSRTSGGSSSTENGLKRRANRNGGRKPAKRAKSEDDMEPEEAERVRVRRMRNKEAAARCRKRRMDLIGKLSGEVEGWESKKRALEKEIKQLKGEKEELQYILETHSQTCSLRGSSSVSLPQSTSNHIRGSNNPSAVVAIKSEPCTLEANTTQALPDLFTTIGSALNDQLVKPKRPASLSFNKPREVQGVMIETPSSIITTLGFDCVTTGLTPSCPIVSSIITPTFTPTLHTPSNCSSQQRTSSGFDLSSTSEFVLL